MRWAAAALLALAAVACAPSLPPPVGRAWVLRARSYMEAERFEDAANAYEKGLSASRKVAADPQVWCELADALGMAQGGNLRGRPRELIARALSLNPAHPRALEMAGSAAYEAGEYRLAEAYWRELLAQVPAGTSTHRELMGAIERARGR
jgi:cytochrome c-type biogenesis protein CcmH